MANVGDYIDSGIQFISDALTEASNLAKAEEARQQKGSQAVDALAANTADKSVANNEAAAKRSSGLVGLESGGQAASKTQAPAVADGEGVVLGDLA